MRKSAYIEIPEKRRVKVVIQTMRKDDGGTLFGIHGFISNELQKMSAVYVDVVSFTHIYLTGQYLEIFLEECDTADILITDRWNHPTAENP